jgi:hypothetical protein
LTQYTTFCYSLQHEKQTTSGIETSKGTGPDLSEAGRRIEQVGDIHFSLNFGGGGCVPRKEEVMSRTVRQQAMQEIALWLVKAALIGAAGAFIGFVIAGAASQ